MMALSKELQEIRYQHQENKRNELIKEAIEERNLLINNPNLSLESKILNASSLKQDSQLSTKKEESTAVKLEQMRLEKIKKKQVCIYKLT